MHAHHNLGDERAIRHDGWTLTRRREFIEALAAGLSISRACARVGMSRESAYKLRRRDAGFAREWDAALQTAREQAAADFLAMLPERLRRAMSQLSTM